MHWILLVINLLFPAAPDPQAAASEMLHEYGQEAVDAAKQIVCADDPTTPGCAP